MNIHLEYNHIISYITHINALPVCNVLTIVNHTSTSSEIDIEIKFIDELAEEWLIHGIYVQANHSFEIDFINHPIRFNESFLYDLKEKRSTQFEVIIKEGQHILYQQSFNIDVIPRNAWLGIQYHPNLIPSFVTPFRRDLEPILSDVYTKMNINQPLGYLTQVKEDARLQMEALYLTLQEANIEIKADLLDDSSSETTIQDAARILECKQASRLEISLLYAACLETMGLNPLLVFTNNDVIVGCFLEDQSFMSPIEDDLSALSKRIAKGIETIELLYLTDLSLPYQTSVTEVSEIVKSDEFVFLVDIQKARLFNTPSYKDKETSDLFYVKSDQIQVSIEDQSNQSIKRTRLETWQSKLLNLSLRNTLLHFKPTKKTICLMEGSLDILQTMIIQGKELSFVSYPFELQNQEQKDNNKMLERPILSNNQQLSESELKNLHLMTMQESDELDLAIKNLYYASRSALEENGANTLFLAVGFLKWFENSQSKVPRYAPILLYPIELIRKSSIKGYVVRFRDEEVQINTTLLEKLRVDFNIEIPQIEQLLINQETLDLQSIFNLFRTTIKDQREWDIIELSYINLFSFNQFVMWNDLKNRTSQILENEIVSSIVMGQPQFKQQPLKQVDDLDQNETFIPVLETDSSQRLAIKAALQGNSFVLHGPPGTGKSQTITSMIALAIKEGKSVLFVAEKMAALNVVYQYLQRVGLADFALELHSNKAKKSDVLRQLESTLNLTHTGMINEQASNLESLKQSQKQLMQISEHYHEVNADGFSIFNLIGIYLDQGEVIVESISKETLELFNMNQLTWLTNQIKSIHEYARQLKDPKTHPLKQFKMGYLTIKQEDYLVTKLIHIEKLFSKFNQKWIMNDPYYEQCYYQQVRLMIKIYDLFYTSNGLFKNIMMSQQPFNIAIDDIISKGIKQNQIKDQLLQVFNPMILNIDSQELYLQYMDMKQSMFIIKYFKQNKLNKKLRLYQNQQVKTLNLASIIENIQTYQSLNQEIQEFMNLNHEYFIEAWQDKQTNWQQFKETLQNTRQIMKYMDQLKQTGFDVDTYINALIHSKQSISQTEIMEMISLFDMIELEVMEVNTLMASNLMLELENVKRNDENIRQINQNIHNLNQWIPYQQATKELIDYGLQPFVEAYEEHLDDSRFERSVIKSMSYYYLLDMIEQDPILNTMNLNSISELIRQYTTQQELAKEINKHEIREKLIQQLPNTNESSSNMSELGILKKAIRSQGRGISIRSLFNQTSHVIRRITPCMLMSPISIAQYIDTDFDKFDLIIFDEASQVFTHQAIGAIARGKQLIVVGDPKQLPPTTFFVNMNEEDDIEFENIDQESILDECQAALFPELHLRWHYRSKHESLIAFSNMKYYDQMLYTFPSVNHLESKVQFKWIEGYYDRGKTKENINEAKAIIEEVERRLTDPKQSHHSIGIVTFNQVQQRLIQNRLEELLKTKPELENILKNQKEPLFIKNLENVQGDERDIILFSIGYGKDKQGKMTMNFGPLNQIGGWRRLNVVVSRSRYEMIVFSTIQPEDIDLSRTSAKGVIGLKQFLAYARNSKELPATNAHIKTNDLIVDDIKRSLQLKGYQVDSYIGNSIYKIDLGISYLNKQSSYQIAILTDGRMYHQTPTLQDKQIVQPTVLKRLGWKVIHVSGLEWFRHKEMTLESIINQMKADDEPIIKTTPISYSEPIKVEKHYYKHYEINQTRSKDLFYTNQELVNQTIDEIVQNASPIHIEDLFKRVIQVFTGIQLTQKAKDYLEALLKRSNYYLDENPNETIVYLSKQSFMSYQEVRYYKDDKRPFEYIPIQELENTIIQILHLEISLDQENLYKEVFNAHGYKVLGDKAKQRIDVALSHLLNKSIKEEHGKYLAISIE